MRRHKMHRLKWCRRCPFEIDKYVTKESTTVTKKKVGDHWHFGTGVIQYGICQRQHFNKLNRVRVDWRPCAVCYKKEQAMEKRKKYLRQKAQLEKRQVPSFLRDELDRFKARMERKLMKRLKKDLERKVSEEVNRRLAIIEEERIYGPLQTPQPQTPKRRRNHTERLEQSCTDLGKYLSEEFPDPPSLPSELSPPSPPCTPYPPIDSADDSDYTLSSQSTMTSLSFVPAPPPTSPRNSIDTDDVYIGWKTSRKF